MHTLKQIHIRNALLLNLEGAYPNIPTLDSIGLWMRRIGHQLSRAQLIRHLVALKDWGYVRKQRTYTRKKRSTSYQITALGSHFLEAQCSESITSNHTHY